MVKHHAHKVSMGEVGDTAETGWGGTQGVGKFLKGSGTIGTTFCI